VALVGVIAASVLAGCGGTKTAGSSITLYNGQHVETTDALVTAFEKQTGIQVNVRSDDEDVFANQIVQEGSRSPATSSTRRTHRPWSSSRRRDCWPPWNPSTLSHVASKYNSPQGDWVGVDGAGERVDLQHHPVEAGPAPHLRHAAGRPSMEGQAGVGRRGDGLPADRHLDRQGHGKAATLSWLQAVKSMPAATSTPTTRSSPTW